MDIVVEVCKIDEIHPHQNADRLELAIVKGWTCVVPLGTYEVGDLVVFVPPEAMLPQTFIDRHTITYLKNKHGRVGVVKLRGVYSEGIIVDNVDRYAAGKDVAKEYGITKWVEKAARMHAGMRSGQERSKKQQNPHFLKYTDLRHYKDFNSVLQLGEPVIITEKIHGTNFRAGRVYRPLPANRWIQFKEWYQRRFGSLDPFVPIYGSHNVQLRFKKEFKGHFTSNIYLEAYDKYELMKRLPDKVTVFGEIYGPEFQNHYSYGLIAKECLFYEVMVDKGFMSPKLGLTYLKHIGLPTVPVLYEGPWDPVIAEELAMGNSLLDPDTIREGIVISALNCREVPGVGRVIFRYISPEYLAQKNRTEHR